jgi:hypothetical protein
MLKLFHSVFPDFQEGKEEKKEEAEDESLTPII